MNWPYRRSCSACGPAGPSTCRASIRPSAVIDSIFAHLERAPQRYPTRGASGQPYDGRVAVSRRGEQSIRQRDRARAVGSVCVELPVAAHCSGERVQLGRVLALDLCRESLAAAVVESTFGPRGQRVLGVPLAASAVDRKRTADRMVPAHDELDQALSRDHQREKVAVELVTASIAHGCNRLDVAVDQPQQEVEHVDAEAHERPGSSTGGVVLPARELPSDMPHAARTRRGGPIASLSS